MRKLYYLMIAICLATIVQAQNNLPARLTDQQILDKIAKNRPLKGAIIPADIKDRLGATHVGGKYFFTDEPYLIEGCRKMTELGYGVVKLWFRKDPSGYPYHSEWNVSKDITLKELAQHPYFASCFDMPFSTFALSVDGAGIKTTDESAAKEEKEIYELTKYLLEKYKDRNVTFILHNWEGDWMMRGGTGDYARWTRKSGELVKAVDGDRYTVLVPADSTQRINAMAKWFRARQNGVNRARSEVKRSKCKVYHAIEANKVMDSKDGIPGIINSVLPLVETDMVSWSSYDGLDDTGLKLYKGIEYIKENIRPTKFMKGKKIVFLGEIGIPEQRYEGLTEKGPVVDRWDAYIGVCLALNVPYLIQWELYCNEPKNEALRKLKDTRKTDEMRGFWLIRPDGTMGFAAQYFDQLLKNACRKLPTLKSTTFSLDDNALIEGKRRVSAGDPSVIAPLEKLKKSAESLLQRPNVNVTQKEDGWQRFLPKDHPVDSHEFISFSIYFYPDTAKGKSLRDPWINLERLGSNDSMRRKFDYDRNSNMTHRVTTFAKAWYFTGDQRFSKAAVSQLREWFLNPNTKMLPQMDHAQFVPFHPVWGLGAYWGMIDAMGYHEILNSIGMIRNSGDWTDEDEMKMKEWIHDWTHWLRTSEQALKEGRKEGNNNHGIFYDIQLTTGWMFLGNYKGVNWNDSARIYLDKVVPDYRILYQIDAEGGMYKELPRPNAAGYECMCLKGFEILALIASKFDIDLWNRNSQSADKRSVREAIEWLIPYYKGEKKWTFGNVEKNPLKPNHAFEIFWLSSKYLGGEHLKTFQELILPAIESDRLKTHEYNLLFPR